MKPLDCFDHDAYLSYLTHCKLVLNFNYIFLHKRNALCSEFSCALCELYFFNQEHFSLIKSIHLQYLVLIYHELQVTKYSNTVRVLQSAANGFSSLNFIPCDLCESVIQLRLRYMTSEIKLSLEIIDTVYV
jgi:hypothetical protein